MAKTKQQKQEIVQELQENIGKQTSISFVDYKGLDMPSLIELRSKLQEVGARLLIVKKTLLQRALKEKGIEIDTKPLEGQVAVIFGYEDPVSPIKAAHIFGKGSDKLHILGGYFEDSVQDAAAMQAVATLPSREELLAKAVGSMAAPLVGLQNVLQGNIKGLVYILAQRAKM